MAPNLRNIPHFSGAMLLRSNQDVVFCRRTVGRIADELRFSLISKVMLVTAASELGRNAVVHGGGGACEWSILSKVDQAGIRLVFVDQGPGIPNLELAMRDRWTSGGGLGLGLSGAKRLVHEFTIESTVGQGTRVVVVRWCALGPAGLRR
jgi:serine/threonine-protein kinase RsbT